MPWLIFNDDDKYMRRNGKRITWVLKTRLAAKYETRAIAEYHAFKLLPTTQWWTIELSMHEVNPKYKDTDKPSAPKTAEQLAEMWADKDFTDEEKHELPYRTMATRLLFGEEMPTGIHNPYYVGGAQEGSRPRADARVLVDRLAARLMSGEAKPPRDADGDIALPLPRKRGAVIDGVSVLRESLNSTWKASCERKALKRNP
jgi:hypothetical protein